MNGTTEFRLKLDAFYVLVPCSEESGNRTAKHNADVGGKPDSAHVHHVAQDLILDQTDTEHLDYVFTQARLLEFNGIEWDERNQHLHLDQHPSGRRYWVRITKAGDTLPLFHDVL